MGTVMTMSQKRIRSSRKTITAFVFLSATSLLSAAVGRVIVSGRDAVGGARSTIARDEGERLFRVETFGGNGRTCETCHSMKTGTISPADVIKRLEKNRDDALFLHDGLDDGVQGTSRITEHATIRITRPLPLNVRLADEPSATSVVLLRGIPGTINTPALDPALMYDLRATSLEEQALGAIHDHAENTVEPTLQQLALIADFQRFDRRFFSSHALQNFANGEPPPALPPGNTPSEQRGRLMFVDAEFQPGSTNGICALCHSGPMLNRTNQFAPAAVGGPPGSGIANIGVSERNLLNLPEHTFLIDNGLGDVRTVVISDPGIVLTTPRPRELPPPFIRHPAFFAGFFKIPSLWSVKTTAPYFHDNHAKSLEEVAAFYTNLFAETLDLHLTPQDEKDIVAFLKLLK